MMTDGRFIHCNKKDHEQTLVQFANRSHDLMTEQSPDEKFGRDHHNIHEQRKNGRKKKLKKYIFRSIILYIFFSFKETIAFYIL